MANFLWDNLFKKEETSIHSVLAKNFLFESLTAKEIGFVKEIVHIRHYRPGEPVFRQGEIGVGMYIIVQGGVDMLVDRTLGENSDAQTHSVLVSRLTAGDFFGELSLVEENGRRTATAVSCSETQLIGFFKADLMEIVDRNPSTGAKILKRLAEILGKRLKETAVRVSELKQQMTDLELNTQGQE